jgi:hypothetical protein
MFQAKKCADHLYLARLKADGLHGFETKQLTSLFAKLLELDDSTMK